MEVVQPGEEKALWRLSNPFQYLKGLRELERDFGKGQIVMGQGEMAFN